MDDDDTRAGQAGEDPVLPPLAEALAGLDREARQAFIEVIVLLRTFPAWAVWLPQRGRSWTAIRAASARAPSVDLPMIWVHAVTAAELADGMRDVDAQVIPP